MEDKIRVFAAELGRAAPYRIMDWQGWQVYDAPLPTGIMDAATPEALFEDEMQDEEPAFILVRGEELRLSREEETAAIVALLPSEECSCEDSLEDDEDDFED